MLKICSNISDIRLDKYISEVFKISRRHTSFLISNKYVKVNNKPVAKSYNVNFKDEINVEIKKFGIKLNYNKLKIVWENNELIAIYKPPMFHSAIIFKSQYSVEDYIKNLNKNFLLLNRLDFQTQGLLLVAKNKTVYKKFKELERKLCVEKFYFGVLKNKLSRKVIVDNELHAKRNVVVKVLGITNDNNITIASPLAFYKGFFPVNIKIYKGARHQIRAHLSFIKKPLLYDYKYYGKDKTSKPENYFLFCYGYRIRELDIEIFDYKLLKDKFREFLARFKMED
jgi:23S rRNA pseudouridine1911/1915/1917 synthase